MANKATQSFAPITESTTQEATYKLSEQVSLYKNAQLDDLFDNLPKLPTIGSLLKEGRTRYNLTQSALSDLTGVTTAEISRLEADKTLKPAKEVLISLAPYIGYPYTYLLLCAGYSGVFSEELYYNKAKELIPHTKIIADIYNADSEFLEVLSDINRLSLTDIQLLKRLISLLKRPSIKDSDNPLENCISRSLKSIKSYLNEQLEIITNLLNISCQRF